MIEDALSFIFFAGMILWGLYLIDRLFEYEHQRHYSEWIADGRPSGIFWRPSEDQTSLGRSEFGVGCLTRWIFFTPDWIKKDEYARLLLRTFRVIEIILILALIYKSV